MAPDGEGDKCRDIKFGMGRWNKGVNGGSDIGENCDASGESGGRGGGIRLLRHLGGEATKGYWDV